MASSAAIATIAALPKSCASSGPEMRKPEPMIDASGVTVARQLSERAKRPKLSSRVTMSVASPAAMVINKRPLSFGLNRSAWTE